MLAPLTFSLRWLAAMHMYEERAGGRWGAGPGPATSADMELPLHVAPGGLVLFLKFFIEMFQQSQFSFWPGGQYG